MREFVPPPGVLIVLLALSLVGCSPDTQDTHPLGTLELDLTGDATATGNVYVASHWSRAVPATRDNGDTVLSYATWVVQNLLGEPTVPGVVEVPLLPAPEEAFHRITCNDLLLAEHPSCTENPDDRVATGRLIIYRDLNGNGQLDQIGPEEGPVIDSVLAELRGAPLLHVESLDPDTFVSRTFLEFAPAFLPEAAFSPGLHVRTNPLDEPACRACVESIVIGCVGAYDACIAAGTAESDCTADRRLCVNDGRVCADTCQSTLFPDGASFELEVPPVPIERQGAYQCSEYLVSSATQCGVGATHPLPPELIIVGQTCLPLGESYLGNFEAPYDSERPCETGFSCVSQISLAPDAPVPTDWPCTVEVALLGESCADTPCHSALTCNASMVCAE